MTLSQIAERIAYSLGQPLDFILLKNLEFSIVYWRAVLYRRDMERNGISSEFLQVVYFDLIKVDKADACDFEIGCEFVLRTSVKVPKPLRWKQDVAFKFIGTADGKPFAQANFEEIRYICFNKYTSKEVRYVYANGYIYLFGDYGLLKKMRGEYVVADPRQISMVCDECWNSSVDFPIAEDMIEAIVKGILSGEFKVQPEETGEVNVAID